MPIIDFPTINYDDFGDDPKRAIDKLNDIHRQLDWLLRRLDGQNIVQEITQIVEPVEPSPDEEEKPTVADGYGLNPEYMKYYPNKCYNSSFEVFNNTTLKPDYWDTSGVVSPASEFDNTYSLKLTPGQYAEQIEINDIGFADPAWWSWCPDTRISFRVKGNGGKVRVSVWQGGGTVPLWYWGKDADGKNIKVNVPSPYYLIFDTAADWSTALRTFAATPGGSGKIKLRFDNFGSKDIYIDVVTIEADWTGKWPSYYEHGPGSNPLYIRARVGGRNLWVQTETPIAIETGDLWVDTTQEA